MIQTKVLCIFDGFGLAPRTPNNVSSIAKMPNLRSLLKNNWWTTLNADGKFVGQEDGLVGNSEVGHMNLGGLKLVPQLSYQVTNSATSSFDLNQRENPEQLFDPKILLQQRFQNSSIPKVIHLIGLFSTGTIHSDLRHWAGAIKAAGKSGAEKIVLHIISDGRDSDRQSLLETWNYFINSYDKTLDNCKDKIVLGSLGGRFYGMDRDKNWERVSEGVISFFAQKTIYKLKEQMKLSKFLEEKYYIDSNNLFSKIKHTSFFHKPGCKNIEAITEFIEFNTRSSYLEGIYDENILPQSLELGPTFDQAKSEGIYYNDTVWMLNFRTDRMKQMSQMLCDLNNYFDLKLSILGMNDYGTGKEKILSPDLNEFDANFQGYYPIFKNKPVQNTLAEKISSLGKTQLHIAETEKYSHVTYFFNGGQHKKTQGEDWVVIDSNKVESHAQKPEMKAKEITDYILENGLGKYDYIIVNYANPDMVGHTGDISAAVESMNYLDKELGRLINNCLENDHKLLLTADHGNIEVVGEYEVNGKILVDTEHNPNFVPCVIVDKNFDKYAFKQKIIDKCKQLEIEFDIDTFEDVLEQDNSINIQDNEKWLTKEEIPSAKLGLWYAGLVFLSM